MLPYSCRNDHGTLRGAAALVMCPGGMSVSAATAFPEENSGAGEKNGDSLLLESRLRNTLPQKNDRTRGAAPSPEKADPRDPALQAGEEYGIIHLNAQEETTHVRQQETD